jgi:hypothetical protein
MINSKKYISVLTITIAIFGMAILVSSMLSERKLAELREIQNQVTQDILASETQFALLEETSCKDIGKSFLSQELGTLGERLAYAENQGFNDSEVGSLRRNYSLLQIKDYLLMKRVTEKCGTSPVFILYFYSNEGDCDDCQKMGYVLTALQEKYPSIRIYSFDYNLDLEAVQTLIRIYKVEPRLPAIIINSDPYYGFRTLDHVETNVPAINRLSAEIEAETEEEN